MAALVILLGAAVLCGWALDVPLLKSISTAWVTMKANTAVCFALAGVALWFSAVPRLRGPAAALVVLIAALTLAQYIFGADVRIDQLLFKEVAPIQTSNPGRMAPATALNFILIGLALLFLNARRRFWAVEVMVLAVFITSLMAVIGYVYDVRLFYGLAEAYTTMAIHTAVAFLILCAAVPAARPDIGMIGVLFSKGPEGIIYRRMIPIAAIFPPVFGWVQLYGEASGYYSPQFGLAIFTCLNILTLALMIWWTGGSVRKIADDQRRAMREVDRFFDVSRDMLCIAGTDGRFRRLNAVWEKNLGYTRQELLSKPFMAFIHPDDHAATAGAYKSQAEGEEIISFENRYLCKDGSYRWLLWNATPVMDDGLIYAAARDITQSKSLQMELTRARDDLERRVAERTEELSTSLSLLERSQEFNRVLLDNLAEGVVACDTEGKLTLFNRAARDWHGCDASRIPPKEWAKHYDLFGPDGKTALATEQIPLFRAFRSERVRDAEMCIVAKGAPPRFVLASADPLFDPAGKRIGAVAVMHDITERRKLEKQLLQSQKMEAIGKLAGGVAHDFNNMLMAITSFSDLALMGLPEDHVVRPHLSEIQSVADRAAGLTRQLLAFSRQQTIEPQVLDLNELITNLDKMLGRLIGDSIEVRTKLSKPLGRVKVDPGQIEQVIVNLAVNARDAMPRGGVLTIETDDVEFDTDYVQTHMEVRAGAYVRLAISDTGVGMTEEVRSRIFEPFFTTKEQGRGTGLGLATCFGVVKQHGGNIEVYSEVGRGTIFKIYLPCVEDAFAAPARRATPKELPRGNETILLVEDEAQVRVAVAGILRAQGYDVLEAGNGVEALKVSETHARKAIHLVLTDVAMPRMDGRELCRRLGPARPDARFIFMSGYMPGALEAVDGGAMPDFVQKPVRAAQLIQKVREALDRK